VIALDKAIEYLEEKGYQEACEILKSTTKQKNAVELKGCGSMQKPRDEFGVIVSDILDKFSTEEKISSVRVIDSDLAGSYGFSHIKKRHPEIFVEGGISERNNMLFAAGFGAEKSRQGITATFAAFNSMWLSEVQMAELNERRALIHISHNGVADMADNTCHFGINSFFSDGGIGDVNTRLYAPADNHQMRIMLEKVFKDQGMRFFLTTRSAVPEILDENGDPFYGDGYEFTGKDEIIRKGTQGYVISYGDSLHRVLDAVERLRAEGKDVGLINKPTLNVFDDEVVEVIKDSPFVLVVETQNRKTGLGSKFGSFLMNTHGTSVPYS
ncbi:transketolase, partial [bacterium M21]